ncbi:hypothetical protein JXB37_03175 [candidate division WOR-3 bacterium]|nr:hypothetical protein [candidate division WOR-3 bacterium]
MRCITQREPGTAAGYALLAVLITGLVLAVWAVLVVHVVRVPVDATRPGFNIEDAVDGCGIPALAGTPGRDAGFGELPEAKGGQDV